MKLIACLACALLAVACRSTAPTTTDSRSDSLRVSFDPSGTDRPAGWIYAFDRGELVDLCVYVWPEGRWTLAAETAPGSYGTKIAEGPIEDGRVQGFPVGLIESSRHLYVAGRVEASLDGRALPRHTESAPAP